MMPKKMSGMKSYEKELVLKEFFQARPKLKPVGGIESGNRGFAIALSDGRHLKITSDASEVKVCNALIGKRNKYMCDIYDVGSFYNPKVDLHQYSWIIMEHLYKSKEQQWVNDAFNDFRHSWFSLYPTSIIDFMTWSDLWLIYKRNETDKIYRAYKLLSEYLKNINNDKPPIEWISDKDIEKRLENAQCFFRFFYDAYKELLSICPYARIDLNEGNFMFDLKGNLKTLDIQSELV